MNKFNCSKLLVTGIVKIWIQIKTVISIDNGRCKCNTQRESVTYNSPLRFVKCHNLRPKLDFY